MNNLRHSQTVGPGAEQRAGSAAPHHEMFSLAQSEQLATDQGAEVYKLTAQHAASEPASVGSAGEQQQKLAATKSHARGRSAAELCGVGGATEILSDGGGTQSAATIALVIQGRLPRPDHVCIVDTGRERKTTWQYLDAVIRPALRTIGLEVHRIMPEWASVAAHGKNWLSHNSQHVLLPGFTDQTGEVGKLSGFCSARWKVEVQNRYVREVLGVPSNRQRQWINFSLDEVRRAVRMMKGEDYQAGLIYFLLIHGVPLKRQQAIREVERMGWPTPPRSACWMCPNQGDGEWRELKANHPDEFAAACALEKEIQAHDPFIWFHQSCTPLADVDFSQPEDLFADRPCSTGGCFT